jgi:hypothetical protein
MFGRRTPRSRVLDSQENPGWRGRLLAPCWLDFYCDPGAEVPLWIEGSGMAYAQSVPVSATLRRDLLNYQSWFESLPLDEEALPEKFLQAGRDLLTRVRDELPPPWRITGTWLGEPGQ